MPKRAWGLCEECLAQASPTNIAQACGPRTEPHTPHRSIKHVEWFAPATRLQQRTSPAPRAALKLRRPLHAHACSETEGYLRAREEELAREQERLRQQQEERDALAAQVGARQADRLGPAARGVRDAARLPWRAEQSAADAHSRPASQPGSVDAFASSSTLTPRALCTHPPTARPSPPPRRRPRPSARAPRRTPRAACTYSRRPRRRCRRNRPRPSRTRR